MNQQLAERNNLVELYSDGSCLGGNPGKGGWGCVLLDQWHRKEMSGYVNHATNNQMELLAVIKGLEALREPCHVTVFSDSQYVVRPITLGWTTNWVRHNWIGSAGVPIKNIPLWKSLMKLCLVHEVNFVWVKGHDGVIENETCDRLAKAAAKHAKA